MRLFVELDKMQVNIQEVKHDLRQIEQIADLPTPITCKSGGFEKLAQKNLEIRTSNLETSKICVK